MSRTYRRIKSRKGNRKSNYASWKIKEDVVMRKAVTGDEDPESFFMTIIKNGVRQKVEIKEVKWWRVEKGGRASDLLLDTRSGQHNIPKVLRRFLEKEHRLQSKGEIKKALRKGDFEDFTVSSVKPKDGGREWW